MKYSTNTTLFYYDPEANKEPGLPANSVVFSSLYLGKLS